MAQNTLVWLLSKGLNDIATSGETPTFDIKWSLPIYDHLTDGTVMTNPDANPGPDMDDGTTTPSHNQSAPGDFNGIFYVNNVKYALSQWLSEGGYTALTETSGWAKNPEWSVTGLILGSRPKSPAVGQNGNTKYAFGSVSNGAFVEGTEPMPYIIPDWATSLLYENVRYDGTSTEDPEEGQDPLAYAHYTVYLRCQETQSDTFIQGDIRFNKVLLFTDIGGAPVPIAMVCLATPVALFANNQGQSNSMAISFQLGFNPNDTNVENVTFDNLYWTKVGEYPDHEGDMRLFSRNKLVLGELGDDSADPAFVEINGRTPYTNILDYKYYNSANINNLNIKIGQQNFCIFSSGPSDSSFEPCQIGGTFSLLVYNAGNISSTFTLQSNFTLCTANAAGGGIGSNTLTTDCSTISSTTLSKNKIHASLLVGDDLRSLLNPYSGSSSNVFHRSISRSLFIGSNNNISFPVIRESFQEVLADYSIIVGSRNFVYSGFQEGTYSAWASRTTIFGKNNQVNNTWDVSNGWNAQVVRGEVADTYILGSVNCIGNHTTEDVQDFNDSCTLNYVFGNYNVVPQNIRSGTGFASTTRTNRYVMGSSNNIVIGDDATVTPDVYIFGSKNKVEIDAESNDNGNSKYVFGSGVNVESWEEFTFGHGCGGIHNGHKAHRNNANIHILRMGLNQNIYALNVVVGGRYTYLSNQEVEQHNDLMLPFTTQIASNPSYFKEGTLCLNPESETINGQEGFYKMYYWYPAGLIPPAQNPN